MNDKPTKNETLEQQLAEANERLAAAEQRATHAEAALNDRRTDAQKQLDADTAAIVAVLQRDTDWRAHDPDE